MATAKKPGPFVVFDETLNAVVSPELATEADAKAFQKATANASHKYRVDQAAAASDEDG